jgi:hypothetical protein
MRFRSFTMLSVILLLAFSAAYADKTTHQTMAHQAGTAVKDTLGTAADTSAALPVPATATSVFVTLMGDSAMSYVVQAKHGDGKWHVVDVLDTNAAGARESSPDLTQKIAGAHTVRVILDNLTAGTSAYQRAVLTFTED